MQLSLDYIKLNNTLALDLHLHLGGQFLEQYFDHRNELNRVVYYTWIELSIETHIAGLF